MFDFDAKTKIFLIVMGWALLLFYWEKQKPKEEFQNSLLMLIALVLIGIFATIIETMH